MRARACARVDVVHVHDVATSHCCMTRLVQQLDSDDTCARRRDVVRDERAVQRRSERARRRRGRASASTRTRCVTRCPCPWRRCRASASCRSRPADTTSTTYFLLDSHGSNSSKARDGSDSERSRVVDSPMRAATLVPASGECGGARARTRSGAATTTTTTRATCRRWCE